jgi:hypothetical protein
MWFQSHLNWNILEHNRDIRRLEVVDLLVELVGIEPTTSSLRTRWAADRFDCDFNNLRATFTYQLRLHLVRIWYVIWYSPKN